MAEPVTVTASTAVAEQHYRKLEKMYLAAPINAYYRPKISISRGVAEIVMPMDPKFFHAAGAVHGSVYFKALDDAAFFAVNSLVEDTFALTLTYNVYLLRPISHGSMRAVGRVVHAGARTFIAEAEVFDSQGQVIARGSGTFVKSKIKLSPELGYGV